MKYICVHGHFYQPPRENPWLEAIEPQDSAAPYHDWNARINAECYAPNAASRILDDRDRIVDIVNNYSRISFDFGPTLLSWLEVKAPDVYQAVLEADRDSRERYGGHGSALAQVYNHVILPLATEDEKEIQVVWGIRDFEHRYRRKPEGMWLSEAAVDLETLETLARHDIRFTVLAPSQARRVRPLGGGSWRDVDSGTVDTSVAYLQRLPSGREIALFFYDGPTSRAVAFEGLLHRGENFARRLMEAVQKNDRPPLAHIATDGETYGHHHPHGDMALAYALHAIEGQTGVRLINYGEFLEKFPPHEEVEIRENTSWSCAHGVERWRSDCGCHTGGAPGWNQAWRAPLRAALDGLRDRSVAASRPRLEALLARPKAAILDYVEVILDRSPSNVTAFLARHVLRPLDDAEASTVLKLLELERQLQLMYTSCGWFFNDLAGLETIQILRYAGRAAQLARDVLRAPLEAGFLEELAKARSNRPEMGNGRDIYERNVTPNEVTFESLAAHYAITSLFETYPESTTLYCYDVERSDWTTTQAGKTKLVAGKATLISRITRASAMLEFAVVHLGDHTLTAGVRRATAEDHHAELVRSLGEPFQRGDTASVLRLVDKTFHPNLYDLRSLFGDEQRRIVAYLLQTTLEEAEAIHRQLYEHHVATMRFLADLGVPSPQVLSVAAEVVLNGNLRRALALDDTDEETVGNIVREAAREGVVLDDAGLAYVARESLEHLAERLFESEEDPAAIVELRNKVRLVLSLPFEVDLWRVQNLYFRAVQDLHQRSAAVEERFQQELRALAEDLSIRLPSEP